MPDINGRELAEVLSVFLPELPVIGISADPGAVPDRRLPILRKPFTPEELLEVVGRARLRSREVRSRVREKRTRAHLLLEAAKAAHLQAREMQDRVDLVAAAIELRRLNGDAHRRAK
jgi:FixJ family two-component response regulator